MEVVAAGEAVVLEETEFSGIHCRCHPPSLLCASRYGTFFLVCDEPHAMEKAAEAVGQET